MSEVGRGCLFPHSCKIWGSGICFGCSAYVFYHYKKMPIAKVADRRFSLVICALFAGLGIYNSIAYSSVFCNKHRMVDHPIRRFRQKPP